MIVIGLMSGASRTSIEVAVCEITGQPPAVRADVLSSLAIPWPVDLHKLLLEVWQPRTIDAADLCLLDVAVGEAFAAAALEGIAAAGYYPEQIDLIGMQGPTIRHEVRDDGHVVASLQVGEASIVPEWTGITTISSFCQRDIAAGGQGAPLTGYVDWLLLRHPEHERAVLYLDQIASMVFVPPRSAPKAQPLAFEVGPGLVLIDYAEQQLTDGGPGDPDSAESGTVDQGLLEHLLTDPYLKRQPPKTLNQFAYTPELAATLWAEARDNGISPAVILETFTAFTVQCVADACQRFCTSTLDELLITGQGRRYPHLMRRLREEISPVTLLAHEDVGLDSGSKRALGVAVLAYEAWHHRACTLPSLTGVQHPTVLGAILPGQNYPRLLQQTWEAQQHPAR